MLEGFYDESNATSEGFQFVHGLPRVLSDSTREVTHPPPLLAVPGPPGFAYLALEFRLLIVVNPIG
jgi:hypothetical protein